MSVAQGGSYQSGSLASNPTVAPIDLTVRGSDWLWAVFAIMLATGLGMAAWSHSLPYGQRSFHNLSMIILFTASIAYFSMASDLGATPIAVEFVRRQSTLYDGPENTVYRSIWYVRYIDWTVTTPALLLTLLLSTGLPMSDIVIVVFWDLVMIITGLVGALVQSQYKWGYFTFGCIAMLIVIWYLVGPARSAARALGDDVHSAYVRSALVLSFLWFLYPIAWGLCDGANVISTDSEMIFYGILDVLAKPGYTILHLFAIRKIQYSRFGFASGHSSMGQFATTGVKGILAGEAIEHAGNGHHHGHHHEKQGLANGSNGVGTHHHHGGNVGSDTNNTHSTGIAPPVGDANAATTSGPAAGTIGHHGHDAAGHHHGATHTGGAVSGASQV